MRAKAEMSAQTLAQKNKPNTLVLYNMHTVLLGRRKSISRNKNGNRQWNVSKT